MKYFDIAYSNSTIQTTDIKGKNYAEVNQRIKAFRMCCPNGLIETEIVSCADGVCVFKASVYDDDRKLLGTGHAYEKENSTFINKTSYIENCETSAVGRALGMCGFGIDASVCSAEELENAQLQQKQIEEELVKLNALWATLRSQLADLGCDFRDSLTNDYIISHAKVPTQDNRQLDVEQLTRLCDAYRQMIDKKKNEAKK